MASPGQKGGFVALYCAHCHEKGKGTDPCTIKTDDCLHCNILTEEQKLRLPTLSYLEIEGKK